MHEFAIKTKIGWVAGINRAHMVVTCTTDIRLVKTFKTHKAANAFRRKYENTGMGLNADAEVVQVPFFFGC
jgi:hypothetical protein